MLSAAILKTGKIKSKKRSTEVLQPVLNRVAIAILAMILPVENTTYLDLLPHIGSNLHLVLRFLEVFCLRVIYDDRVRATQESCFGLHYPDSQRSDCRMFSAFPSASLISHCFKLFFLFFNHPGNSVC